MYITNECIIIVYNRSQKTSKSYILLAANIHLTNHKFFHVMLMYFLQTPQTIEHGSIQSIDWRPLDFLSVYYNFEPQNVHCTMYMSANVCICDRFNFTVYGGGVI